MWTAVEHNSAGSRLLERIHGRTKRIRVADLKRAAAVTALIVCFASAGDAQTASTSQSPDAPDLTVQVRVDVAADFNARIWSYYELRRKLERGAPALVVTDDPAEIRRAVRALARRIQVARADAKQGDIFTPTVSGEFRKALTFAVNTETWEAIMDDNPGAFSTQVNGTYPYDKPLSTVPASILAGLPTLPDGIQYRFLGRDLILLDTRANLIVDRLPDAIRCVRCTV
jgi:hypothetical protein